MVILSAYLLARRKSVLYMIVWLPTSEDSARWLGPFAPVEFRHQGSAINEREAKDWQDDQQGITTQVVDMGHRSEKGRTYVNELTRERRQRFRTADIG
jgi:hypothetical protein